MSRLRYGAFLIPLAVALVIAACGSGRSAAPDSSPPTQAPEAEATQQAPEVGAAATPAPAPVTPMEPTPEPPAAVSPRTAPSVDVAEPSLQPQPDPDVMETAPQPDPDVTETAPQPDSASSPAPEDNDPVDPHAIVAAFEEVLIGLYESVLPSVAHIHVLGDLQADGPFGDSGRLAPSEGSGFVWSSDGHIVTNHHVIDGASEITVVFASGLELEATVLGSDPDSDLAVLKVDPPPDGLKEAGLGDSDQLRVGQLAVAVGSPFSQEFSMTNGIVSALGRVLQAGSSNFSNPEIIQTDTPINPGNSGGPLFDRHGNVIGINSVIISRSGSSSGVGFAVPINTAKRIVPVLIEEGDYSYAYLGITGVTLTSSLAEVNGLPPDTRGVLVVEVVPEGPAEAAGILASEGTTEVDGVEYPIDGYVITAIDGTPVRGMDDLVTYMAQNNRPGDTVTFDVITEDGVGQVRVVLAVRPEVLG